jgi:hypothetical protein
MASGELIAISTWFSVLTALSIAVGYLLIHLRYVTYGRECALLDGMRRFRKDAPEDWNSSATIMSGEQILDYVVGEMSVPPSMPA